MFFGKHQILKNVIVGCLLLTLVALRATCEMAQQCLPSECSQQSTCDDQSSVCHDSEANQKTTHCDATPAQHSDDTLPEYCCSTWYLFTADKFELPTHISQVSLRSLYEPAFFFPTHSSSPVHIANHTLLSANYRAPADPLFLVTHSFRV